VLGHIGLDPATSLAAQETVGADNYYTVRDDGLERRWGGRVWLNPPYSLMSRFVEKLVGEYRAGSVKAAILLSSNGNDAAWFHHAAESATTICFNKVRIKFIDGNEPGSERSSPRSGSAFLYFGPDALRFREIFAMFGTIVVPWREQSVTTAEATSAAKRAPVGNGSAPQLDIFPHGGVTS
jgi:hypothetical protein